MKTMTCKQLKGVCDKEFHGETVEKWLNYHKSTVWK